VGVEQLYNQSEIKADVKRERERRVAERGKYEREKVREKK
jgi:hypothetical protein